MAKDNDNRHNTKQIDFSAKSLGKIKRVQPESMSESDDIKPVKQSRAVKAKPNNDNKRQKKPTNKATRAVFDKRRNDDYLSGADSNTFGVIEGGRSFKRMMTKAIVGALCAVIVLGCMIFCVTRPTGIGEWLKTAFTSGEDANGYPISISDSAADSMYYAGDRLHVLSETDIRYYDKNGGLLYSRVLGFSNAAVRTSAMRTLTFDRGGTQYRIDSVADEIAVKSTDNKLIDCDIADNGSYALGTLSESEAGTVTVYNKRNEKIYKFHSADKQILRVVISRDGKSIGVCSVSIENSQAVSTVSLYSIKSEKAVKVEDFAGQTVYALRFANNSTLCGITNEGWFALGKNDVKKVSFESKSPMKYQFTDNGDTLISLAGASNSAENDIVIIKPNGEKAADFKVDSTVDSISADGGKIFVLNSALDTYSYAGEKMSSCEIKPGAICVRAAFGKAAVLYSAGVELY